VASPELAAPRSRPPRAIPFSAFSAADTNYFLDAESQRTPSVAEEYEEAERVENGTAATSKDTLIEQPVQQKNR